MNHWLPRELALLESRIERANEKGWRKELFEYLERRKLLQTAEEQAHLLREIPEVIADGIEIDSTDSPDELEEITTSPILLHRENSQEGKCATMGNIVPVTKIPWMTNLEDLYTPLSPKVSWYIPSNGEVWKQKDEDGSFPSFVTVLRPDYFK